MQKYIYRNKNNEFFNYYLENGNLLEAELHSQNNDTKILAKNLQPFISVTFSNSERPNIFFLDKDNNLCLSKFQDNIWIDEPIHSLNFKPDFFKVLEFQNSYALVYCMKTSETRVFDCYIMYIGDTTSTPIFLTKAYSQSQNIFHIEEIALNHYALLFKTVENKKVHLNYMEINNNRQSNPVVVASNDFYIQDETFLFDEYAYCLYTKKRNYSQQLCLKVISNFKDIPTKEYLIFEGKSIDNSNIYLSNDKLHIHFVAGKNTMTKISDDLLNVQFGKLVSEYENGSTFEKAKFLGYSLNSDDFRANNLYINNKRQLSILNKYCNFGLNTTLKAISSEPTKIETSSQITPVSNKNKQQNQTIEQYELRNKALLEENRNLKRQLRKFES